MDYLTTRTSLSQIQHGFVHGSVNYKKGCTRLAAASDKVYLLLAHDQWLSPVTLASFTTKDDHHDIAEILLKVALNTINQIFSLELIFYGFHIAIRVKSPFQLVVFLHVNGHSFHNISQN